MTGSIYYSILFLDLDRKHSHPFETNQFNNIVTISNSLENLVQTLLLYEEVKLPVCICCENKRPVLDRLEQYSNVASISMCTSHHSDLNEINLSINYFTLVKRNSFEHPHQWQLEAHLDAMNANNQKDINSHIRQIIQQLLEADIYNPGIFVEQSLNNAY